MGGTFLTSNYNETIFEGIETTVGYIISETQLKEKYPGLTIEEAKSEYFDEIRNVTHVGFYLINEDKIALVNYNLGDMCSILNSMEFEPNASQVQIPIEKFENPADNLLLSEDGSITNIVALPFSEFEQLLKIDNYDELISVLNKIFNAVKEAQGILIDANDLHLQENKNENILEVEQELLTGNFKGSHIVSSFEISYKGVTENNSLKSINQILSALIDSFTNLALILDERGKSNSEATMAKEYIYYLVDSIDDISEEKDINILKSKMEEFYKKELVNIKQLAVVYDRCTKEYNKEKKEKELMQVNSSKIENVPVVDTKTKIDAKLMKKFFDEKIIGQDEAKKDVIAAIIMNMLSENPSDKNSCLLVGPTGSGKTLIAETVSEFLDLPLEIIDTTQLTVPGYVGANIEDFLARLIGKAGGDVKKAECGIVVLDEIDKKGTEKNDDVSGKGVLNTFLPFIQGTTYDVKYNGKTIPFNTSKLTIFATGAFTDVAKGKLEQTNLEGYSNSKIGFNSNFKKDDKKEDIVYPKLEIDDFVKYGNMPIEIIGRFPTIAQLTGHTKESLRQILTESNISALLSEKRKLEKLGISLSWTNGYLDKVAEKAIELKTGARSLKSTVEKSVKEARWETLTNLESFCGIILTEKTVEDNLDCELVLQNGKTCNLKEYLEGKKTTELAVISKVKIYQK